MFKWSDDYSQDVLLSAKPLFRKPYDKNRLGPFYKIEAIAPSISNSDSTLSSLGPVKASTVIVNIIENEIKDKFVDEEVLSNLLTTTHKLNSEIIKKSFGQTKSKHIGYQPSRNSVAYTSKFNQGTYLEVFEDSINSIQSTNSNFQFMIKDDTDTENKKCNEYEDITENNE